MGEQAGEHDVLALRLAIDAVSEAFAFYIGLGQFVLVIPAAVADQAVHVGAVGAVRVAEHAQGGLLDAAAVHRLKRQRMLANEVLLDRFGGTGGQQGGLRQ